MPFPDEARRVAVVDYRESWPAEFRAIARRLLASVDGSAVVGADHVGSTAVPGLAAKDVIDVQLRTLDVDDCRIHERLSEHGYRERTETWNRLEPAQGRDWPKRVFAPPVGGRAVNIHVRHVEAPTVRSAVLFRDFLRADLAVREAWGEFKQVTAARLHELSDYGAVKAPAWKLLMLAAERWAERAGWRLPPPDLLPGTPSPDGAQT